MKIVFKYDKKWKRKAEVIKKRDGYICQICKRQGKIVDGTLVHHIYPTDRFPQLGMDSDNLITICKDCHERLHDRKTGQLTAEGQALKKWKGQTVKVINVHGAPCSGKTTYVESIAGRNDIIYDYDKLAKAMTVNDMHDNNPALIDLLLQYRALLLHELASNNSFDNAFIISVYPIDLQDFYNAEYYHIDTKKEICLQRAKTEKTKQLIEKYFTPPNTY